MAGLVFGGVGVAAALQGRSTASSRSGRSPWRSSTGAKAKLPNATVSSEISPEYLGVGYILGPRIGGIMVSGSVIAWIVLIPLLTLVGIPDATSTRTSPRSASRRRRSTAGAGRTTPSASTAPTCA